MNHRNEIALIYISQKNYLCYPYVAETRDDVEPLFESIDDKIEESGLDITELREFLEEDIIPV